MQFSTLQEIRQSRNNLEAFGGYNHSLRISDGEFYDMKNLTSDYYPIMSPRNPRTKLTSISGTILGAIYKEGLIYILDETEVAKLYINGTEFTGFTLTKDEAKQIVSMGAYIVIFPDKKYVNTKDLTEYGVLDICNTTQTYEITPCDADGNSLTPANYDRAVDYPDYKESSEPPENPQNSMIWIDTSQDPVVPKKYNASNSMWIVLSPCYRKIRSKGISKDIKAGDGVRLYTNNSTPAVEKELIEGSVVVVKSEYNNTTSDYIVVEGSARYSWNGEAELITKRTTPKMDFVVESSNRLWGCRYGLNNNGETVNEIYASKLGDFKNWECYSGISTDSYAASCGTDGAWTGAVNYMGNPIFFKENVMHKVYGTYPANYQINTTECDGVQKGSDKSLAVVNNTLFYKTTNGIGVYSGSLPQNVTELFGDIKYKDAVAGAYGSKYYISMKNVNDNSSTMFVYDSSKGLWHKEDGVGIQDFIPSQNDMCYLSGGAIYSVSGNSGIGYTSQESQVEWMAETGILGMTIRKSSKSSSPIPGSKYVSSIIVRLALELGSKVDFYIEYDSSGAWEHVSTLSGISLRSFTTVIRPRRCDHFRIKIEGIGKAKIYSMCQNIEQGSEY